MSKHEIPVEVSDEITLANMKNQLAYLTKQLRNYKNGEWMHAEDVVETEQLIKCFKVLIKYYGG